MKNTKRPNASNDVHQKITDRIIATIEAGVGKWRMPWSRSGSAGVRPVNAHTGNRYKGVNVVALWAAAEFIGYGSGFWATYKQWRDLGAQVHKGEKANLIVFYKKMEREVEDKETGKPKTESRFFARASWVFNADQVDGWQAPKPEVRSPVEILKHAEDFVAATGADIRHGGNRAYYRPSTDHIQMPHREFFTGTSTSTASEGYYATLLHELTHYAGHERRLDRDMRGRFGNRAYAMEELVAELGAAFLCADLAITNEPRPDHAAYISGWLDVLKRDKKAIFTAARKASQAADYLAGLQSAAPVMALPSENRARA